MPFRQLILFVKNCQVFMLPIPNAVADKIIKLRPFRLNRSVQTDCCRWRRLDIGRSRRSTECCSWQRWSYYVDVGSWQSRTTRNGRATTQLSPWGKWCRHVVLLMPRTTSCCGCLSRRSWRGRPRRERLTVCRWTINNRNERKNSAFWRRLCLVP